MPVGQTRVAVGVPAWIVLAFVDGVIYMPGGGAASGGASGTTMHQVFRPAMRCE
jgi:hypothetical protein